MAADDITGIGLLRALGRNAFQAFPQRCLEEPVVKLSTPLAPVVIVSAPSSIQHVLLDHHRDYGRLPVGKRVLRPIIGNGLLLSEGDAWKRQRQAMAPAFAPRHVETLAPHIVSAAERALAMLETRRGCAEDLFDFFQSLSLNVGATVMFSVDVSRIESELRRLLTQFLTGIGIPTVADFLLPPWVPSIGTVRRASFRRRWRRLTDSVISARRGASDGDARRRTDLFDMLARVHGNTSDDLLADEVSTMLVAGHETTALTLFWACTLLAHTPTLQAELASEAAAADWTGISSAAEHPGNVPELPLARAVVKETLRLYSPAFLTARLALTTHRVCDTEIPKGSTVFVPFWLLHRDPRRWQEPGTFDPSRFLDAPPPGRFDYLPFGVGPHVCIGAQLALLEATLVLSRMMRDNVIVQSGGTRPLPVGRLSTRPSHSPAYLVLQR